MSDAVPSGHPATSHPADIIRVFQLPIMNPFSTIYIFMPSRRTPRCSRHCRLPPALRALDVQGDSLPGLTTLEQFRQYALDNNRQLMIAREKVRQAEYQKKEAFAAYLRASTSTVDTSQPAKTLGVTPTSSCP